MTDQLRSPICAWGGWSRNCDGETLCGDGWSALARDGRQWFVVVDGLGHGPGAHEATQAALDSFASATDLDPRAVLRRMHAQIRHTRGVAVTILSFGAGRLVGCGVGNVEVRSTNTKLSPLLGRGVVGARLGTVRGFECEVAAGDRFVVFTDGVRRAPWPDTVWTDTPEDAARGLIASCGRSTDDATTLIVEMSVQGS